MFKTAYGEKLRPVIQCGPSVTRQSFRDQCNVNVIVEKYQRTGVLPAVNAMRGRFADVTGLDFQTALDLVSSAEAAFRELPGLVRKRFSNDPAAFLDFVQNPEHAEELVAMGLASKRELRESGEPVSMPVADEGGE